MSKSLFEGGGGLRKDFFLLCFTKKVSHEVLLEYLLTFLADANAQED